MSSRKPSKSTDTDASEPTDAASIEKAKASAQDVEAERLAEAKQQLVTRVASFEHEGPLPPAMEFASYGKTLPSAPERILAMAEKAQDRSDARKDRSLDAEIEAWKRRQTQDTVGQWLGFTVVIAALALGAYAGGWFGGIIAATGGAGLGISMVLRAGATKPSEEDDEKPARG